MSIKNISFLTILCTCFLISGCDNGTSPSDDFIKAPYPCKDGKAAETFNCKNVDLFAHVSRQDLHANIPSGGVYVNDLWGWSDPLTDKNYALVGVADGVTFVDITDWENPIVVGKLMESHISNAKYSSIPKVDYSVCLIGVGANKSASEKGSIWRDHKVYNNHLFVVSDNTTHGMQVFDLTRLRNYDSTFVSFSHDALYDDFGNAHNIVINEATGYAYATGVTTAEKCGSRQTGSGLHIVDIRDPKNPTFAGCYIDPETDGPSSPNIAAGYIHDAQCVNYNGPDADHKGQEVCFNSAEGNLVIADVSDKSNPVTIGFNRVQDMQYSHQGWLSEDHKYFLMNDEADERNFGRNTKTYVWDVQDLENPTFVGFYEHNTTSIDHNLYIKGNIVYEANYKSGLRLLEIKSLANAQLREVGYFDTYAKDDNNTETISESNDDFLGTWSNYPFFDNGIVILSDITQGLFIVRPRLK